MTQSNQTFATPQEALAHHGVKGMKWGVRKKEDTGGGDSGSAGPSKKQQRRETKARNLEGKAAISDVRVAEIKAELATMPRTGGGIRTSYKRADLREQQQAYENRSYVLNKNAERVRQGKLTSNQKVAIAGGVAAVGVLGLIGYSTLKESGQLNSLTLRGQAFMRGDKNLFKRNELLGSGKLSPDGVLKSVVKGLNPNYASQGGQMNCRRCSFAYEMRRRGFDVVATPTNIGMGHTESNLINALTPGKGNVRDARSLMSMVNSGVGVRGQRAGDRRRNPADIFSLANKAGLDLQSGHDTAGFGKALADKISSQPHGARGEALFTFGRFGHSMSWENFNGKPVIFDTQKGTKYDLSDPESIHQLAGKWGTPMKVDSTRLDNLDLDQAFLSRWVSNNNTGSGR